MKYVVALLLLAAGYLLPGGGALAHEDSNPNASQWEVRKHANEGVVRIMSGGIDSTAFRVAAELAGVMREAEHLRLLPILGKGSVQNVADMLYLKGIDLAIVQTDALEFIKENNVHPAIERRINYIAKLYNEEVHILARAEVGALADLAGQKVSFGPKTDGSSVTAANLFEAAQVEVEPVFADPEIALEMLKRGEIAAMVYVEGKPVKLFQDLEAQSGLRFVSVAAPGDLAEKYLPSRLTEDDYPGLIEPGAQVNTIAVGTVLTAFNWKQDTSRYKNVAAFVKQLFEHIDELQEAPNHPKWKEVNLAAEVPEWLRHRAVADLLPQYLAAASETPVATNECSEPALRVAFREFFNQINVVPASENLTPQQSEERLFQEFQKWLSNRSE